MAKTAASGAASSGAGAGASGSKGTAAGAGGSGKGAGGKGSIAGGDESTVGKGGKPGGKTTAGKGGKSGTVEDDDPDDDAAGDDDVDDDDLEDDDEGEEPADDDEDDDDDAPARGKGKGKGKDDGKGGKGSKDGKGSKTGGKAGQAPKAPAKYELDLPEGADRYIDDADLSAFKKSARARGLTNDQAQDALDEYAGGLEAQSERFYGEVADDDVLGGDNLAETERLVRLGLDKLEPKNTADGKALRAMLVKTGYGNKIEVVRFLRKVGKMMAEDSGGSSGSGGVETKDAAEKLYGGTTAAD